MPSTNRVMGDTLARGLTKRTHREVMSRLDQMPPSTKTKLAARHKQALRIIRGALGPLVIYESTEGKGRKMSTVLIAVMPAEHGRFDVAMLHTTPLEEPLIGGLFCITEHAMSRLRQGRVELAKEITPAALNVLHLMRQCQEEGGDLADLWAACAKHELLSPTGRFCLKVADEDGKLLATTWIPDAATSPAQVQVLQARRADIKVFA